MTPSWSEIDRAAEDALLPLDDVRLEGLRTFVHGDGQGFYARFLYYLALEVPLAVELGTEWGVATAHLCAAAKLVAGVDDGQTHEILEKFIPRWYGNLVFLKMDSVEAAGQVAGMGEVGLLFQDTRPEGHAAEWRAYRPLMAEGAIWVCGDVALSRSWRLFPRRRKRAYEGLRGARRIGVVRL